MASPRPIVILVTGAFCVSGCDSWPLHAALPDPVEAPSGVGELVSVAEDEAVLDGDVQPLGTFSEATDLTISGFAGACGWDEDAAWPTWPSHPVDDDGDGVIDRTEPRHAGWYTGDVDTFGLGLSEPSTLSATLTWDNTPAGGENAPYQPGTEGAWTTESDLDLLVFSVVGGAATAVLAEEGFTLSAPESLGAPLRIDGGGEVALAVGCHHSVASAYTLQVAVRLDPRESIGQDTALFTEAPDD